VLCSFLSGSASMHESKRLDCWRRNGTRGGGKPATGRACTSSTPSLSRSCASALLVVLRATATGSAESLVPVDTASLRFHPVVPSESEHPTTAPAMPLLGV